jgi:hypothetical protein
VAQDRAGKLGEEALDQVEPGAVFGREGELEAAGRLSGEPSLGFSGDMRRMVVENQLDRRTGRVSGIEKLEEFDELAAAPAAASSTIRADSRGPWPCGLPGSGRRLECLPIW